MSDHSTIPRVRRKRTDRPARPYDEFPLQPHGSGFWSKRVRGRLVYFGKWGRRENGKLICLPDGGDWRAALADYQARIDDLQAGRIPRNRTTDSEGPRLHALFNRFLTSKTRQCEAGELSRRSFFEYRVATDRMVLLFVNPLVADLRPDDFEKLRATFAKKWGPHRVGKFVQLVRSVFKFGQEIGVLKTPVLFGPSFKKPSKAVMRRHKARSDKKLFTASELRMILAALNGEEVTVNVKVAEQKQVKIQRNLPLRAAVLLAINTGCGNSDVSSLKFSHLDFDSRWLDFPRVKTGLARRVPLWQEVVVALQTAIAVRPKPKHDGDRHHVFLNRSGRRLVQTTEKSHGVDPAADGWTELVLALRISADGNTIVGTGNRNGNTEAFVAVIPTIVPEPAAGALALLGVSSILLLRRRSLWRPNKHPIAGRLKGAIR